VRTRRSHGFTDLEAAAHMHRQFTEALLEDRHVVALPGAGPEAVADVVWERMLSGELRHRP
jgi:hypothetical protein